MTKINNRLKLNVSIVAAIFALMLLPHSNNFAASSSEVTYGPPGELVDVGSYRLHINCMGEHKPAVILDSGLGGFSLDWLKVQKLLRDKIMVCAYDRAGYGWSDQGPSPRVTEQIVDELHTLLEKVEVGPPYVLVGHSFGGYNMQYFGKIYPRLTAGMVLVESSHPQQAERMPDIPAFRKHTRRSRIISVFNPSFINMYPEESRPWVRSVYSQDKSHFARQREFKLFNYSAFQVNRINRQLDVPLAVVTRGKRTWDDTPYGDQQEMAWRNMQEELLQLSSESWQVFANDSGHLVHFQEPGLVAEAIISVASRYCHQDDADASVKSSSFCLQY